MRKPSIYDFKSPTEVMLIKNLANLRMKEKTGQLTPQEQDMLHGLVHHDELCMYYAYAPYLRTFFTNAHTMTIDLNAYVKELILWKYPYYLHKMNEAVDLLLEDAYQTIDQPINDIFPINFETDYGEIIFCFDLSKDISLAALDRIYVGFTPAFVHQFMLGVPEKSILHDLEKYLSCYFFDVYNTNEIPLPDYIHPIIGQKAMAVYAQLKAYAVTHVGG